MAMMRGFPQRLALAAALSLCVVPVKAETYQHEEIRIAMPEAGARGLEALLVRPDHPGRYPLVLLSHGSPRKAEDRQKMSPWGQYPLALEFARRGWAAAIVMRRGYGDSGGPYAENRRSCQDVDYLEAARASVRDLKAAINWLIKRPDIDGSRMVAVGQSAGGLATVALTGDAPPGLVAAISFAGGRGSIRDFEICREDRLIAAFRTFGKTSRIPMLWVYAENDHFFAPPLAEKMRNAFVEAGGNVEFIHAPAFGKDGHRLFSLTGISKWTPYVDAFFAKNKLTLRASPMALPPLPALAPPPQLSANGRQTFELYLRGGQHKAFAVASDGHFGWQTGKRTVEEARNTALKFCRDGAKDCRVVFVDDAAAP